jgi:hypothetical protein
MSKSDQGAKLNESCMFLCSGPDARSFSSAAILWLLLFSFSRLLAAIAERCRDEPGCVSLSVRLEWGWRSSGRDRLCGRELERECDEVFEVSERSDARCSLKYSSRLVGSSSASAMLVNFGVDGTAADRTARHT